MDSHVGISSGGHAFLMANRNRNSAVGHKNSRHRSPCIRICKVHIDCIKYKYNTSCFFYFNLTKMPQSPFFIIVSPGRNPLRCSELGLTPCAPNK